MFELFVNSDLIRKGVERQFATEVERAAEPRFRRLRGWLAADRRRPVTSRAGERWDCAEAPSHR